MDGILVRHYIDRAADFYQGLDLLRDEEPYRNSSALLAIHSAISYCDALRLALGDEKLYAENHLDASTSLKRLLSESHLTDKTGFRHLDDLIAMKSSIAYGRRRLDGVRSRQIAIKAERFAKWVSMTAIRLNLEEWNR